MQLLCNKLLENENEELPYAFFVNDQEVSKALSEVVAEQGLDGEAVLTVVYQPQAVFRVRAVTQCSATIPGTNPWREHM